VTPAARPARWEEAAEVAGLLNALNSLDGGTPPVAMTAAIVRRDLLGDAPRATLLVAEHAGAVAGFATGGPIYDAARAADAMMLLDLYVAPQARRRGLGRALMAGLAAAARQRGTACLWWGVDDGDDEAMLFYAAIGARTEEHFTGLLLAGDALSTLAAEAAR
jgi:GNAT superfamily N-acetyltransferase